MKKPVLTLRATLTLLFVSGALYVVAITLYISRVIAPLSTDLSLQTRATIEEFTKLKAGADSLRAVAISAKSAFRVSPDSAAGVLAAARSRLDEVQSTTSPTALLRIPPAMRRAMTRSSDEEVGVAGLLIEASAELEVGRPDLAEPRIRIADSIASGFAVTIAEAEMAGLVNLLQNQREMGGRSDAIRRTVMLWLFVGAALFPVALYLVHRRLYRPLGRIDSGLKALANGSFPSLDVDYDDEVGQLARHFNALTPMLRAQAEAAHTLAERLARILDESFNEIFLFDPQTLAILQANGRAEQDLGYSEGELGSLTLADIAPTLPIDPVRGWLSRDPGERSRRNYQTAFQRKDGGEFPVELNLQFSAAEDPPILLAVARDLTEVMERDAQLAQAQKMEAVGQLTGGVAHDFNNLLAVIIGNAELLREELDPASPLLSMTQSVLHSAERGARLTQRLLAFSRKQTLQPRVVDLNKMIAGMTDLIARSLGETIEVETIGAGGLWKCEVDSSQMENVLLNLAINARDSMPTGGKLTIETANVRFDDAYAEAEGVEPGQYVMMAVTDTGYGMAPEIVERVFEPFFTTKAVGRGSGLGLSMVYGVLKQSRGHVKIYSEVGQGTTVKTYLPRTIAEATGSDAPDMEGTPVGAGELVLVVEDDADVREYVRTVLLRLGYKCVAVEGGSEALEAYREAGGDVDLVLTDVVLGGDTNGVQLAREIQKISDRTRILFMSGYTENAIVHGGKLDRGIELLEKPFHKDVLARKLRKVLKERG